MFIIATLEMDIMRSLLQLQLTLNSLDFVQCTCLLYRVRLLLTQWRCFYKNNTLKDDPFYYVQLWNDNNKFEDKDIYFFNAKHSEDGGGGTADKDEHVVKDLLEMNYEQSLVKLKLAKSKIGKELIEWVHLFFKESAAVYYVLFKPAIQKFGFDAHLKDQLNTIHPNYCVGLERLHHKMEADFSCLFFLHDPNSSSSTNPTNLTANIPSSSPNSSSALSESSSVTSLLDVESDSSLRSSFNSSRSEERRV